VLLVIPPTVGLSAGQTQPNLPLFLSKRFSQTVKEDLDEITCSPFIFFDALPLVRAMKHVYSTYDLKFSNDIPIYRLIPDN